MSKVKRSYGVCLLIDLLVDLNKAKPRKFNKLMRYYIRQKVGSKKIGDLNKYLKDVEDAGNMNASELYENVMNKFL